MSVSQGWVIAAIEQNYVQKSRGMKEQAPSKRWAEGWTFKARENLSSSIE